MTNPTQPEVEAVARAIAAAFCESTGAAFCKSTGQDEFDVVTYQWRDFEPEARAAIAAYVAAMKPGSPKVDDNGVTQADREAAAWSILQRLKFAHGGEQPWMDASTMSMRMGEQDDHYEVQAFRRHRLASANPARVAALEAETSALRISWWNDMRQRGVNQDVALAKINDALTGKPPS